MIEPEALRQAQIAAEEEQQRLLRYKRAWDAYYGRFPKPLKVKKGQPDDNVAVNKARVIVDKGVSFLFGKSISFEIERGRTTEDEAWLAEVWAANKQATLLQKLAMNGGACGHVFVKLVPDSPLTRPYPRLIVLDPATVTVRWTHDDVDDVVSYRIQYAATDPAAGKVMNHRQLIERVNESAWRITDQESRPDERVWMTVKVTPWPWPFPPVASAQNLPVPNEHWGLSDLEDDVIGLNKARNFDLSNLLRIIRYHAHPKTWGTGFSATQIQVGPDESLVLPAGATLQNLEMQSDLAASLEYDRRLDEALHEISRIPPIATGKFDDVGKLSGLALQILYGPLLELTSTKRLTYGDLLADVNARLLTIGRRREYRSVTVTTLWPELLPSDPKSEREVAILDDTLGVASRETLATKLGYDWESEQAKREQEARAGAAIGETMLQQFERGQERPPEGERAR